MRRWSPPQSYIRNILQAFQQDYFLCQPGSPFLEVSQEYEKKCPQFRGWDYGLIKIGAFCDKKRWSEHQQNVWTNQTDWESSFWAFLIERLYQVAMKGREMGWIVEPVEIVWFPNLVGGKKEVLRFPKMKDCLMRAYPVGLRETGFIFIMPNQPTTMLESWDNCCLN